jgi:uncharacterized membrane protein YczE
VWTPPTVRGGPVARWLSLLTGLALFAAGIVMLLESRLGLSPWDVLNQGIAKHTPLSFGIANTVVALVVLAVAWRLGATIGPGTVANALLIGVLVDVLTRTHVFAGVEDESVPVRALVLVAGILVIGGASALYIGGALGAGPRDSLMLVLSRRTRRRAGLVRTVLESSVTAVGFALGGKVGIGTLAFALGIGPAIEASFWLLWRSPLAVQGRPEPAASTIGAG